MNDRLKNVVEVFKDQATAYNKQIKHLEDKVQDINKEYQSHIIQEFKEWLKESRFFHTHDGYIAVDDIIGVKVDDMDAYHPRVILKGFYTRGIDCEKPARFLYGYYDNDAGFLLNELTPVSPKVFCEKTKLVVEDIINHLPYTPTYLYREEGDVFDRFLSDARKGGIDIEYHPEITVSIVN